MTQIVRSRWVRLLGIAVIVTALAGVGAIPSAGASRPSNKTVEVTPEYRRVIQPFNRAYPPSMPPAILPTVTCARGVDGQIETVFGYEHRGVWAWTAYPGLAPPRPRGVPVGHGSPVGYSYFRDGARKVLDLGQVVQFQPGSHPSAFAVRTAKRPTWTLEVPSMAEESESTFPPPPRWQISIRPRRGACGPSVPQHFVAMRGSGIDSAGPADVVRDQSGRITAYSFQATTSSDGTSCTPGGIPIQPRVVFGYGEDGFVPLAPDQIIRVDHIQGGTFTRTEVATRQVADARADIEYGFFTDTYGRCRFGNEVVESTDPVWTEPGGATYGIAEVNGTEEVIAKYAMLPGGVRFR